MGAKRPTEPAVVKAMRRFRETLLELERDLMGELVDAWDRLSLHLEDQAELLARDIEERLEKGEPLTQGRLFQFERYARLLAQAQDASERFNQRAAVTIESAQRDRAQLALDHSQSLIKTASSVDVSFTRLPLQAVESMIGLAGDGQPLMRLLERNYGRAAAGFSDKLIVGTALGWNPRKTARIAAKDLNIPLQGAMTTARTEQMRVYREASRMQYQESGVVGAMQRLSAKDTRVCPACLMADGEIIPLGESMAAHVNCRCTVIPLLADEPPFERELGRGWFLLQDEKTQREILGPGHYDAWKDGAYDLGQLVTRTSDPTWGGSLQVTPLRELA
jgi:SPP1 gp7 family putative phage head morphogenesis protein